MFLSAAFLSSWHQCSDSFVNIILFQQETVQLHELGPICKFPLRFPSLFLNFKIQLSRIFPRAGKTAIVIFTFLIYLFHSWQVYNHSNRISYFIEVHQNLQLRYSEETLGVFRDDRQHH